MSDDPFNHTANKLYQQEQVTNRAVKFTLDIILLVMQFSDCLRKAAVPLAGDYIEFELRNRTDNYIAIIAGRIGANSIKAEGNDETNTLVWVPMQVW